MKQKVKEFVLITGLVGLMYQSIQYLYVFNNAYLDPTYKTLVNINVIGEANLEFIINLIFLPCQLFFIWVVFKWFKNKSEVKQNAI